MSLVEIQFYIRVSNNKLNTTSQQKEINMVQ